MKNRNFKFYKSSISKIEKIKEKVDLIIHLAAEAEYVNHLNPYFYIDQNINQTIRVFEYAKKNNKKIFTLHQVLFMEIITYTHHMRK